MRMNAAEVRVAHVAHPGGEVLRDRGEVCVGELLGATEAPAVVRPSSSDTASSTDQSGVITVTGGKQRAEGRGAGLGEDVLGRDHGALDD